MARKLFLVMLLLLLSLSLGYSYENRKPRVAIMDIQCGSGVSPSIGPQVAELIANEFLASKVFDVVDRKNMDTVFAELTLNASGCTDASCAVDLGKILSVDYIGIGTLARVNGRLRVIIKLVEVETTRTSYSESTEVSEKSLDVGIREIAGILGERYVIQKKKITLDEIDLHINQKRWRLAKLHLDSYLDSDQYFEDSSIKRKEKLINDAWAELCFKESKKAYDNEDYFGAEKQISLAIAAAEGVRKYLDFQSKIRQSREDFEKKFVNELVLKERKLRSERDEFIEKTQMKRDVFKRQEQARLARNKFLDSITVKGTHIAIGRTVTQRDAVDDFSDVAWRGQILWVGALGYKRGTAKVNCSPWFGLDFEIDPTEPNTYYSAGAYFSPFTAISFKFWRVILTMGGDLGAKFARANDDELSLLMGPGALATLEFKLGKKFGVFSEIKLDYYGKVGKNEDSEKSPTVGIYAGLIF